VNINVVRRPDQGRFAKVCAARKERVEGLEIGLCLERKKSNVGSEISIMTRSFGPFCHERCLDKNGMTRWQVFHRS